MDGSRDQRRRAFRLVVSNVAVIAVDDRSGPHGCTASAWAEDPESPFMATALKREGGTRARVARAGRFGASVLNGRQAEIARQFARRGDRFAGVSWSRGPLGQPLIDGALITMECVLHQSVDFGTYDMLIGRIETLAAINEAEALTFYNGSFGTHHPFSAATS